jgi:hypothetical protein
MASLGGPNGAGDQLLACLRRLAIAERIPEPPAALLKRVMRILGSSIAGARPDFTHTLSVIKSRLVRSSESGTQDALRFQELHQKLMSLNATRQTT